MNTGTAARPHRAYFKLVERKDAAVLVSGARGQALGQKVLKYDRVPIKDGDVLKSGELVEVELTLESKNDYEYLLFEDMKPAGYEPDDVRSGYTYEGLGAYRELPCQGCAVVAPQHFKCLSGRRCPPGLPVVAPRFADCLSGMGLPGPGCAVVAPRFADCLSGTRSATTASPSASAPSRWGNTTSATASAPKSPGNCPARAAHCGSAVCSLPFRQGVARPRLFESGSANIRCLSGRNSACSLRRGTACMLRS